MTNKEAYQDGLLDGAIRIGIFFTVLVGAMWYIGGC